jgi:hypothetical protein
VINKDNLTKSQIEAIKEHRTCGLDDAASDYWIITESKHRLKGWTDMDNFDMHHFLTEVLDIDDKFIEMGD